MNNLYADPAHAGTVARLKDRLAQLKREVGDTDEKYPALRELARSGR